MSKQRLNKRRRAAKRRRDYAAMAIVHAQLIRENELLRKIYQGLTEQRKDIMQKLRDQGYTFVQLH
jgi:hypothetical protein